MNGNSSHQITVCTSCRHKGSSCNLGFELIAQLRRAIEAAGDSVTADFEISGVACMAGCDRPCTVAYHSTQKATYLFGDITPETDINDLVAFARQYATLEDEWSTSGKHTGKLRQTTLARVPAAMIVLENAKAFIQ